MSAQLFYVPFDPIYTSRGLFAGAARAYLYLSGTTTLGPVFADAAFTTPIANPVVADALGQLPAFYLDDTIEYRLRLTDRTGIQIGADYDPYVPGRERQGPSGPANSTYATSASVTAMAATSNQSAIIADPLFGGTFAYESGVFTSQLARDPRRAIYIPAFNDPTGQYGAWVRIDVSVINVRWFGAKGDGVTDDIAAIQAAVDYMKGQLGGTLLFPLGDYKISAPIDCGDRLTGLNRVTIQGCGGVGFGNAFLKSGTRIFGTHAGRIFAFVSCEQVSFFDMTFDGDGCEAISQTGSPTVDYLSRLNVQRCAFLTTLKECIKGNLIYETIHNNGFGVYGQPSYLRPGSSHRHIYSLGTSGAIDNLTNVGSVEWNSFFYANGSECMLFANGARRSIQKNTFENNDCTPIRLRGTPLHEIEKNWFERNSGTQFEIDIGAGDVLIDMSGLVIAGNYFDHAGFAGAVGSTTNGSATITITTAPTSGDLRVRDSVYGPGIPTGAKIAALGTGTGGIGTYVLSVPATATAAGVSLNGGILRAVQMDTSNFDDDGWIYERNQQVVPRPITNNYSKLRDQSGTAELTDASGAGLALISGTATFKRSNNVVTLSVPVTWPTTSNTADAKLGGLPFPAASIYTASVLTNINTPYVAPTISNPPTQAQVQAIANAVAAVKGVDVATDGMASTMTLFVPGTLTPLKNADLSGKSLYITISYFVVS